MSEDSIRETEVLDEYTGPTLREHLWEKRRSIAARVLVATVFGAAMGWLLL